MTVCVAALCRFGSQTKYQDWVLGASDQMLTSDVIEFEPRRSKLEWLGQSLVAMVAGNVSIQSGIFSQLRSLIATRDEASDPEVGWVAESYGRLATAAYRAKAEADILGPYGLTWKSFNQQQQNLSAGLVEMLIGGLAESAKDYDLEVGCIIAGVDATGAHIFIGKRGAPSCEDSVGFAAIGTGGWHANSYLMLQGHTREVAASAALVSVFFAKKRGEIAPGVGRATDVFSIGHDGNRGLDGPDSPMVKDLDRLYRRERMAAQRGERGARETMAKYFEKRRVKGG